MQNYFLVKCYTEWTNSCSGNAEKNDVKYSRKFEHAAPINTWTNFANRMFDSAEPWTGRLSPRLESNYSGNKCSKDLTIKREELIPWHPSSFMKSSCTTSMPAFMSHFLPVTIPTFLLIVWCALLNSGLWDLQQTVKIQEFAQEAALGCLILLVAEANTHLGDLTSVLWFLYQSFASYLLKKSENNSELSFYQVRYFALIRDLQNPWKVKAALEVEKAKPQNLKSNPTR